MQADRPGDGRQCFEETADGMKGLKDETLNVLTEMKAGVAVTKAAVLKASKDKAAAASISSITVAPEIGKDNALKEADRQNTFRLAVIGVTKAVAEGITTEGGYSLCHRFRHAYHCQAESVLSVRLFEGVVFSDFWCNGD